MYFYKMIVSLWVCVTKHAQSAENNKFTISLQYLKENVKGEVVFLPAGKCRKFLQSDTIILCVCVCVCVARHAKITQHNKFAISVQHVKEEVSDEVNFLHADKHESLLQFATKIF